MKYCPECTHKLQETLIDGLARKACQAPNCNYVFWDNPVPVVAGIVECGGQIILARNSTWPNDLFSLITGYLEKNETPEQAIIRETKEELGLEGEIDSFIGYYSFFAKNQILLAFSIEATGELITNHEITEVKLLSMQQLGSYSFGRLTLTETIVKDWINTRCAK